MVLVGWLVGSLVDWLVGWLVGVGLLVGWLVGWVGWLLVGWLVVGWLVGWLVLVGVGWCWLVGCCFKVHPRKGLSRPLGDLKQSLDTRRLLMGGLFINCSKCPMTEIMGEARPKQNCWGGAHPKQILIPLRA